MTAPAPARSLDADLAAFWRALEGLGAEVWAAEVQRVAAERWIWHRSRHHQPEHPRLAGMHKRYATRRKARRVRRGR